MKSYIEKREVLCSLAELYLNTQKNSYISVNDGIMHSSNFDDISFLMLMALTYPKEDAINIYSMDIEVSEDTRNFFVEKEYSKITRLKQDKVTLGKIVLQDAKQFYKKQYGNLDDENIEETIKNFFI